MAASQRATVNLGLASTPEVQDPRLLPEFIRLYNAINILAQTIDTYTLDGTQAATVKLVQDDLAALKMNGVFGTLKSTGGFGVNGKEPQTPVALGAAATDLPTALVLLNKIRAALIANGIGS